MNLAGEIVRLNGGFFTRAEALGCGESDRSLRAAVRRGDVLRLRHGMYALAAEHRALDDAARHLVNARAAVAAQRDGVALTGPSGAVLHGFAIWGHDEATVHVLRLGPSASRRQAGVVHHVQARAGDDVHSYGGVLVVSPARAAWECARLSTLEGGVVTLDSALHSDPNLIGPLRELAEQAATHPGSRTARMALRLARSKSESPGESLTRVACFRHGIPEPELQHNVYAADGRLLGRSDFYWPEHRHLAEFDGRVKYERLLKPGQSVTDCVLGEKRREDAMRRTGKGMTRLIWSEVQPAAAARSMAALARDLEQSLSLYAHWR